MKGIYRTIFSVFLLFSALLATVAALPAPFSNTNTSLLQQPNPPATSLDLVTFRKIILAFTSFGQEIPESEVEDTFTGAERAINDLVEAHPDERITNDQFNFRREHGNTLILISANVGGSITWRELSRVLQSLHRFMSGGAGVPDEHYQALEFKIQALPLIDVGFGLIWYFPPGSAIMQKRASPPLPISIAQETDLLASNAASLLLGPNANDDPILYPIPRTCLTLKFYFLGVPIPADIVKFTLQGALAKVRPWLNGAHENDTITNDYYQYITPFTHGTPRVAVTVFSYRGHSMSWRILFEVLFGLFQFATSFSGSNLKQEHYQILGFRIFEESFGKLGVGTISCYIPGEVDSVKRAQAGKEIFDGSALSRKTAPRVLQLPQVSNSTPLHSADARNAESTSPTAVATSVVWPIFGTDILLTFTFLGDPIPPHEVTATVMGAQRYILPILDQSPNLPIVDNHFRYRSNDELVAISVLAYRDKVITWTKLSQVLAGMLQFCVDNHNQVLVFEIDIGEQGRVGFGTFLYAHASRNERAVEKRALLSTAFLPSNAAISPSSPVGTPAAIRFPILLSQDNLLFTDHGPAIPSNELRVNLEYALKDTGLMIDEFPNQVLHSGAYEVQDENLTITISAHTGYEITWLQLDDILLGLRDFVTGCGSHSQTYFQALDFQVNRPGQGNVAYGLVRYTPGSARFSPSNPFEAGKRALQATLSLPSQLAFETEILFRIPGTSDTLVVNDLGVHIPGKLLSRALWHCLDNIWDHINTGPLDPIPRREDDCTFEGVTIATSCHQAAHPQYVISWMTLQDIVDGLNVFTQGDWRTAESQMHRQILEFQLDLEYFGKFVHGFLLYNAQVLTETGNGALNSTLLEMGSVASNSRLTSRNIDKTENRNSNTTPPLPILAVFSNFIPYAIPGTPVTLVITSLGDPIPSLEVGAGLTNALRRISSSAISRAHMPIPGNRYWYRDNISHLCFHVLSRNSRQVITWQQLSWTVAGLSQWMQGDHCRELSFVINVDGEGTIGFGSVGHGPLPIGIPTGLVKTEKRAELPNETFWQLPTSAKAANTGPLHISAITNETLVQLPNATKWPSLATDECIYTPDTGLDICFHHFGDPIPSQQVSLLFTCILRDLPISKDTIPAILYQLRTPDRKVTGRTSILVEWIPHYDFAYDALNRVMQRLERYMIGHGSESSASPHLQNLEFVLQADGIALGTGQVWHLPGKHGVAKRGIVNDDVLLLPNTTSTSALQAVGAISPYSFLVIGTSITLQFYYFSTGMPGFGFQAISTLRNALAKIDPCVETTPNAPIAGDAFQYSKRFGHTKILVFIYTLGSNTISWRDLDAVLDGLAWFMQRDPITSQPCNQGSKFQINADGIGKIGLGTLWWSTGTGALEQRAEAANHVSQPSNSSLSLPGAPFACELYFRSSFISIGSHFLIARHLSIASCSLGMSQNPFFVMKEQC